MPKIFGTSLLGILAATVVFYMIGFLIYGVLFSAQWMEYAGMTEAEAMARNEQLGAMMYISPQLTLYAFIPSNAACP